MHRERIIAFGETERTPWRSCDQHRKAAQARPMLIRPSAMRRTDCAGKKEARPRESRWRRRRHLRRRRPVPALGPLRCSRLAPCAGSVNGDRSCHRSGIPWRRMGGRSLGGSTRDRWGRHHGGLSNDRGGRPLLPAQVTVTGLCQEQCGRSPCPLCHRNRPLCTAICVRESPPGRRFHP
jgi:hypothetical protein